MPQRYPYPQRTDILRLLGPTTLLYKAFGAILMLGGIITYTIVGFPYYMYSIASPKTLF